VAGVEQVVDLVKVVLRMYKVTLLGNGRGVWTATN
jgi:hypothetical protein